jgi:hypothetical protein
MGVLIKSGSALKVKDAADKGASVAEEIPAGKLALTGVVSFSSFGLTEGIVANGVGVLLLRCRSGVMTSMHK